MVSSQINNSFNDLINLLSAESKVNVQASQFLSYVKEKQVSAQSQTAREIKESIRGINRYYDEFEFTAANAKKIKNNIDSLYDQANRLAE